MRVHVAEGGCAHGPRVRPRVWVPVPGPGGRIKARPPSCIGEAAESPHQPQPHTTTRELRMCIITRPCLACTWRRRGRYLTDAPSHGPAVWCADAPTRRRALFEWRLQQGAPAESSPPPGDVELKPSAHAIDDADRLVDLLRVDAQRRGQADDVAVSGLREKPRILQLHAHVHRQRALLRVVDHDR